MTEQTEIAQLRKATREAHEVLQDLRAVVKEGKRLKASIDKAAEVAVNERVSAVVAAGLASFSESLSKAIDEGTARVFARFDTLADMLLGEDKTNKRKGNPSIPELIERAVAAERKSPGGK